MPTKTNELFKMVIVLISLAFGTAHAQNGSGWFEDWTVGSKVVFARAPTGDGSSVMWVEPTEEGEVQLCHMDK